MSEEGEFKKQFGAFFFDNLTGKVHDAKDFFDVFDEARKEFPQLAQITDLIKEGESRLILETLEELHEKREEWFLKWFGSGEKK